MKVRILTNILIIVGAGILVALVFLLFAAVTTSAAASDVAVMEQGDWKLQSRLIRQALVGIAKSKLYGCSTGFYRSALWQARRGYLNDAKSSIANGRRAFYRCQISRIR